QCLKAQKLYKDLVNREIYLKEYEIRSNVTKAYLAVLIAEKNIEILDNNISNLDKLLKETSAVYESGFAEKLDVDRLALSLENLNTTKENLIRLIGLSRNILKFQMGYPLENEISLTDSFDDVVNESSIENTDMTGELDITKRAEYQILDETEKLQNIQLKVIKAGYYPNVSVFATHQQSLQRNKLFNGNEPGLLPATIAGFRVGVPIFDGNEKKAKKQQTMIAIENLKYQKEEFNKAVQLQVMNAKIALENAKITVESRRKTLDLAERIYNTTQIKYREGVGSSLELTQAEQEVYNAQSNLIDAMYDVIVAKTDLDIALGNI
ncbi:MAG: TolC family protein, partial [Bacteroidota bacterium]